MIGISLSLTESNVALSETAKLYLILSFINVLILGNIPDATREYKGCKFADRCPKHNNECQGGDIKMGLVEAKPGHWVDRCSYITS